MKFKTNIKCGGCVAAVTPHLNKAAGAENWSVDTAIAEKLLTIKQDQTIFASAIIAAVQRAGYQAEKI